MQMPNLVTLAVCALILAAKVNQPLRPSFKLTVSLLPQSLRNMVTREAFLALESQILEHLEFDISFDSPVMFLERYLRIYGFDRPEYS